MADQKLNEIPKVQSSELANVKAFFALMTNGEIKQMSKEDMASVVGELIGIDGFCKLEQQQFGTTGKYNKLFTVTANGFAEAIISIGAFSNANTATAVIQVFPTHTANKISVKYLLGEKYNAGHGRLFYAIDENGAYTIYNTSLAYYKNGYIFISKYEVTTHNQQIDNLPSDAIQI